MDWQRTEIEIGNPGFEMPYTTWWNASEVRVAHDWKPFWSEGDPPMEQNQGPCARPEYKPISGADYPHRVLSGKHAQAFFVFYRVMDAGVMTEVSLPRIGFLEFTISAHAWCDGGDDPDVSRGEMYLSLGIDPYGRAEPKAQGVVWTPWVPLDGVWMRARTLPVFIPGTAAITLYVRAWNKWRLKHNDVYLDNAHCFLLEPVGEPQPTPPPPNGDVDYDRIERIMRQVFRDEWPMPE